MFKKSATNKQLGLFTTASSLMCKRESKQYEDERGWHMQFYRNVTCNIDEDVFRPLFDEKMGCPTKAIRQLVAMSILKEGVGCSDETLYENCRYNLLWRAALGLFNIDDQCPAISSYCHLRELICDYEETGENHENLYEKCFRKLTVAQCKAYKVSGKTVRDKKFITSDSVQNPNDTYAACRSKGGKKVKGFAVNITETCDEESKPNLITDVQVEPANKADNTFVEDAVKKTKEVTGNKVDKVHADGAYQSKENRELAADKENGFDFIANGIQGKPSRFDLALQEDGTLEITDKQTAEVMTAIKVKDDKWKIPVKTKEGKDTYRYFDKTSIERSKVRRQTESIPWDERKKRNNVEASIFQYCFHTRNNKTRYRGLIKHTLQAIARCAWINMRRLFLYDIEMSLQIA